MPSHKSEDYKITAVKYYLENENFYVNTCKIFKCSESSLKRWIDKYKSHNMDRLLFWICAKGFVGRYVYFEELKKKNNQTS